MAILKQTDVSGSLNVSGSINVINSVTASAFSGNGAGIVGIVSASYATTASYALNGGGGSSAVSASYASTASVAPNYLPLVGGTLSGDLSTSGNIILNNGVSLYGRRNTGNAQVAFFRYDSGTDDLSTVMGGNIWRVRDTGAGVPMYLTAGGQLVVASSITTPALYGPGNGSGFILARNAANTAYIDLLYMDSSDIARIPRSLTLNGGLTATSAVVNGTTSTMRIGLAGDVNPYIGFNDGSKVAYL